MSLEDIPLEECFRLLRSDEMQPLRSWLCQFRKLKRPGRCAPGLKATALQVSSELGLVITHEMVEVACFCEEVPIGKVADVRCLGLGARRVKRKPPMSFQYWLQHLARRTGDAIGDFIEDAKTDRRFPDVQSPTELRDYLWTRNACSEALVAGAKAWRRYERYFA